MSNFQIIILVVFGVFLIIGVLMFSGFIPGLRSPDIEGLTGQVTIWGTLPRTPVQDLLDEVTQKHRAISIVYVEKSATTFDKDIIEAIASGVGPDLIMLPEELIYRYADKVLPISFETLPERTYRDTFIEEGELYLSSQGALGLPLSVDPLILYWNRDMLSGAGISAPPKTWEELLTMVPALVVKDSSGNIKKAGIAFGEVRNITHAKDVLALLFIGAGNPITSKEEGILRSVLDESLGMSLRPGEEALRFYTEFSNPVKGTYSWNKSLPASRDMFITGDLALYIGYASELFGIRERNPHLNFDVAGVPQTGGEGTKGTLGHILALSVVRNSDNAIGAYGVASLMSGEDFSFKLAQSIALPPVRRDLLSKRPSDAYQNVFYQSALISKSWVDPSPEATNLIFKTAVENVVSGKERPGDAIRTASRELSKLLTR